MTNEISLAFEHLRLSKSQQPNVEKRLNAVSEEWALNARSIRGKKTWKLPKEPAECHCRFLGNQNESFISLASAAGGDDTAAVPC
jgi:hypothetical protein